MERSEQSDDIPMTVSKMSTAADDVADWHDLIGDQSSVTCEDNATVPLGNCSFHPSEQTTPAEAELQYYLLFLLIFPVITVFGNVLVSMSVYRERSLQTVTNYFIVSLAISDIMVAVLVMPFAVYVEVNNGEWRLGDALCDTWVAFDVLCCTASILNLTAISVDRFIAVTLPIQYAKHRNSKRVIAMLSLTWVLSVAISSPIALGMNYTDRRSQTPTLCTFYNSDFLIFSSMGSFYIPCFAMLLLYWGIFRTIRRRVRKLNMAATGRRPNELPATKQLLTARRRDGKQQPRFGDELMSTTGCDVTVRRPNLFTRRNSNRVRAPPDIRLLKEPEMDGAPCPDAERGAEGEALMEEASAGEPRSPTTPESLQTPSAYSSDRVNTSLSSTFTISSSAGCLTSPQTLLPPTPSESLLHYLPNPASTITATPASPCRQRTMDKFTVNLCKKLSKATKSERKAVKTLAIVVGVFLICWMPFFTINIINAICIRTDSSSTSPASAAAATASSSPSFPSSSSSSSASSAAETGTIASISVVTASICHIHPMLFSFLVWLGYINSFINPVIYTLFNIEFRRAFNKILREMCCKANTN